MRGISEDELINLYCEVLEIEKQEKITELLNRNSINHRWSYNNLHILKVSECKKAAKILRKV